MKFAPREMFRIAMPLILSMASYTVMQFCDRIFLSHYSSVAIEAALPAGILAHTAVCFFQALASYAGTFTAQYHGAGRPAEGVRSSAQGIWLALFAWPLMAALIPLGWLVIRTSGHSAEVIAAERTYFTILTAGGVMVTLNAAIGGYFIGIGKTSVNFLSNFVGCGSNVLLNWVMIFGRWGCPSMGITGAAYATLISGVIAILLQFGMMFFEPAVRAAWRERGFRVVAVDWPQLGQILRFGAPAALQTLLDLSVFTVFVFLTGKLGDLALAASNIAFSINNLAFSPLLGFGMAASTLVSQHLGAGDPDAAWRAGNTGLLFGLVYMGFIGSTFVMFPGFYFELFHSANAAFSAAELLQVGRVMMCLMAAWGLLDTLTIVLEQALKGAGDTKFVMLYMTTLGWTLLVPGAVVLTYRGAGIIALWCWMAFYVMVLCSGLVWRWCSGKWRTIKMI